jgi:hypothetical protein
LTKIDSATVAGLNRPARLKLGVVGVKITLAFAEEAGFETLVADTVTVCADAMVAGAT